MVTLKKITALPELKSITLVAGVKGIHRTINGVNVVESADLTEFLRPNEIIEETSIQKITVKQKGKYLSSLINYFPSSFM